VQLCLHHQPVTAAVCAQDEDHSSDDEDDYDEDEDVFTDDDYHEDDDSFSDDGACICMDCMRELEDDEDEDDEDECVDGWETASPDEADGAGHEAPATAQPSEAPAVVAEEHSRLGGHNREVRLSAGSRGILCVACVRLLTACMAVNVQTRLLSHGVYCWVLNLCGVAPCRRSISVSKAVIQTQHDMNCIPIAPCF